MPVPGHYPNVVLIGAQRAGVRWLRWNLDLHPDIAAPPIELEWFSDEALITSRGGRWYREQYASWSGEPFLVDASPGYLAWERKPWETADRLHFATPDARLVAILRQPFDRIYSAASYLGQRGLLPPGYDLATALFQGEQDPRETALIRGSVYEPNLAPFRQHFGDQLLVLLHDDLVADPKGVYATVLRHIGADPDVVPEGLERVRFAGTRTLADLDDQVRADAWFLFQDQVELLGREIGRDLSIWDPARRAR